MKPPQQINSVSEDITRRFFQAVFLLKQSGKIRSLSAICRESSVSPPRYREMILTYGINPSRTECRYKSIEIELIYTLVKNYNVSAKWLITGEGKMLV